MTAKQVSSRRARNAVRSALRRAGLDIFRSKPFHHYVPDYYGRSAASRRDLRDEPVFSDVARTVVEQGRTLLYYDRLWIIFQCLQNLRRALGKGATVRIAEVGVFRGGTTHFLAAASAAVGLSATIDSFDTFTGHDRADLTQADTFHWNADFSDTSFEAVSAYLARFPNVFVHQGRFQDNAERISGNVYHFVHLDVDIYGPTLFALRFFRERLPSCGVIVVDDYGVKRCPGIDQAVSEYLSEDTGMFALHPLTEQVVLKPFVARQHGSTRADGDAGERDE